MNNAVINILVFTSIWLFPQDEFLEEALMGPRISACDNAPFIYIFSFDP